MPEKPEVITVARKLEKNETKIEGVQSCFDGRLPKGFKEKSDGTGEVYPDNEDEATGRVHDASEHKSLDSSKLMLSDLFTNNNIPINYDIDSTCEFDQEIYKYFLSLIGKRFEYSLGGDTCRGFARSLDELVAILNEEYSKKQGDNE